MVRLTVLAVGALVLAGCGGSDGGVEAGGPPTSTAPGATKLSLTLDFAPNAVHAGLYVAQERGLFTDADLAVRIRIPGSGADGAKLLAAGRTDLAIMDIHDVALARQEGADLVAVGAVVQRPLAAVLASPSVARPRDLEGRTVGVTGLPSDDAALDQIVRGDGGDPKAVKRVTIGFEAVPSVVSGKVSAAIGFWNAEGVALTARRPGTKVFRLDAYGAPRYPELLVVATSKTLREQGDAVGRFTAAMAQGYTAVASTPKGDDDEAVRALRVGSGDRSIDPTTTEQQLTAVKPAFRDARGRSGTLDRATMRTWSAWEAKVGITKTPPDVAKMVWSRAPGS
ncbi:ABC transporter substrate-binding protein [Patulibacter sp.]|uniref:ABC transporter substrate-binding protein n=1 Tax=Patulibacter sp. TaxID=1912859 RepID=UPI0027198E90|nr:ABC transporter substrate-binding protein [Patulibacter sp.]MDO9407006.1 ABC transporter substrate-binding protein [Patulibacter sp.]